MQITVSKDVYGRELKSPIEIDRYLYSNLEELKKWVQNDWDNVGLNVGMEGAGKSETSMLIALMMHHRLTLDNVFFTARQFNDWVDNAKKGTVGIWDEGDELSGHWASEMTRSIKRKMKQMRDKNLTLLINTPTIEDLGKYFVLHRTRFVVYTFARAADNRGWYHLFGYHKKHELYLNIKKYGELKKTFDFSKADVMNGYIKGISNQECVKDGDWTSLLDFTMAEYKEKKDLARRENEEEELTPDQIRKEERKQILVRLDRFLAQKQVSVLEKEKAHIIGVKSTAYSEYKNELSEEGAWNA